MALDPIEFVTRYLDLALSDGQIAYLRELYNVPLPRTPGRWDPDEAHAAQEYGFEYAPYEWTPADEAALAEWMER